MKKYLATIHKRSDRHKKGFALSVAAGTTLFIFAIWFLVRSGETAVVTQESTPSLGIAHEVGPFESLTASVGATWGGVMSGLGEIRQSFEKLNLEAGYTEMKENTLDTYGQ